MDAQGIIGNSVAEGAENIFSGVERGKIFSRISLGVYTNGLSCVLKGWGFMRNSIKLIKIEGFKSIKDIDLELGNLNVLIGANGAGKSNFISVFKLLNWISNERLGKYTAISGGASKLLYYGKKVTNTIKIDVDFESAAYHCVLEPTTVADQLIFAHEYASYSEPNEHLGQLNSVCDSFEFSKNGQGETSLAKRSGFDRAADEVLNTFKKWLVYHFNDTSEKAPMKDNCSVDDNRFLRADAANLAAFLYKLKKTNFNCYSQILKTVQLIAPFIKDFYLEPLEENRRTIRFAWEHKESDDYFDISQLSDGTIRSVCLITLLLQPDPPPTILIDEPELGLHPYAIELLASLLKSVSHRTQLVVSSQSSPLVDQLEPENIVVVDYIGGHSEFERKSAHELQAWLEDYTLGELWEKNVLGGRPG
jgi:predicted ATPase